MEAVAKISKIFGTDGGVLLNLYTTFPEEFDCECEPLLAMVDNLPVPLWCERFERRGASGSFALFSDLDTPERVREFVGQQLFVNSGATTEDEEEFFLEDLVGFEVGANGLHGEIIDFYDNEANPLFGVEIDGREVLIPAVEEFIAGIDFENRHVKMVLPDGLVEL